MKRYARRKKFKVKKLFILLFTVMLCVMAGKVLHSSLTTPFLGNITHHMASEDHGWNLILVNRENYIPADYEVQLTELSNGKKVDSRIYPELQEMFNAARAQGYGLFVREGYRTQEEQQQLMNEKIEAYENEGKSKSEAKKLAEQWVAIPGTSEHQLGIAVDINADTTALFDTLPAGRMKQRSYTVDTPGLSALLLCDIVTQSGNGIKMIWKQRHKDVLEEFIKRVEKTLSEDSIEDKIEKLNRSVYNIQYKRKKLLENYLEGVVAKDIYEETDVGYEKKLSEAKTQLSMLEQQYDNEGSLQRRLADFRKALSKNQILEEFDRGIFESIIEKVIVGGYDENGEKDPYKIIFIYKTGFKNEIGNAKERFGKKSKAVETAKEMCSHIVDEVKDVCSYVSDNTCGDGCSLVQKNSR